MRNPILTVSCAPTQPLPPPTGMLWTCFSLRIAWGEPHLFVAKQGNPPNEKKGESILLLSLPLSRSLFVWLPFWPSSILMMQLFPPISPLFCGFSLFCVLLIAVYRWKQRKATRHNVLISRFNEIPVFCFYLQGFRSEEVIGETNLMLRCHLVL